jgi:hypothetical protein
VRGCLRADSIPLLAVGSSPRWVMNLRFGQNVCPLRLLDIGSERSFNVWSSKDRQIYTGLHAYANSVGRVRT